jgi:hypothetical protein
MIRPTIPPRLTKTTGTSPGTGLENPVRPTGKPISDDAETGQPTGTQPVQDQFNDHPSKRTEELAMQHHPDLYRQLVRLTGRGSRSDVETDPAPESKAYA